MSAQAISRPTRTNQESSQAPKNERQGAKVSTKQMTRAAIDGRKVSFPGLDVDGYLVGMDDYHWVIAHITHDQPTNTHEVEIVLVHKSAPVVRISRRQDFPNETEEVRREVDAIGGLFFAYCRRALGLSA